MYISLDLLLICIIFMQNAAIKKKNEGKCGFGVMVSDLVINSWEMSNLSKLISVRFITPMLTEQKFL